MSSESNGRKPDSDRPPPSGRGTRASARVPAAWGAARDALAAVHNLEALLRSPSVPHRTILDLLPELKSSAAVLRHTFEGARGEDVAAATVGGFGGARVDELGRLLDAAARPSEDRGGLASQAHSLADELEASADLLALLERAAAPLPTEVSIGLIVREIGRTAGSGRGREIVVRFENADPDSVVTTDPHVVGPLLSLAVAWVHGLGVGHIAVRARSAPPSASLLVERARPEDTELPLVALRVLPAIPPAAQAAHRVAEQIGALLLIEPQRWTLALAAAG
jgi:hypothetical protein